VTKTLLAGAGTRCSDAARHVASLAFRYGPGIWLDTRGRQGKGRRPRLAYDDKARYALAPFLLGFCLLPATASGSTYRVVPFTPTGSGVRGRCAMPSFLSSPAQTASPTTRTPTSSLPQPKEWRQPKVGRKPTWILSPYSLFSHAFCDLCSLTVLPLPRIRKGGQITCI